jgi:branched-chain amino acid transport system ATP-binding protein
MSPLLEVRDLSVRYGGVEALSGVELDAHGASIVGLIGPNGAGKTSFLDAVTGFTRASGSVTFGGGRIDQLPPHRRARLGLVRTFQSLELFDDLTVRENVRVGAERPTWRSGARDLLRRPRPDRDDDATWALALVGLDDHADAYPEELSHGHRRLVAVARGLAMRPRLLLLDEPAAGLDRHESDELGQRLKRIADAAVGILLVDHDMGLVLGVCSRIYVIEFGRLIAAGGAAEIRSDPEVLRAYLGAHGRACTEREPA